MFLKICGVIFMNFCYFGISKNVIFTLFAFSSPAPVSTPRPQTPLTPRHVKPPQLQTTLIYPPNHPCTRAKKKRRGGFNFAIFPLSNVLHRRAAPASADRLPRQRQHPKAAGIGVPPGLPKIGLLAQINSNQRQIIQKINQPHAWSVCDQILHGSFPREVQYFASNTIRAKIQTAFLELPHDSHEPLKQSLMAHLQRFGAGPSEVFVQLSVAVADLALYMEDWKHAAADLITSFQDQPLLLLDILVAFPEEIDDRHLRISDGRRKDFQKELADDCPLVFQLCEMLLQSSQELPIIAKTFKCLAGFMRFAGPCGVHFGSSILLPASFQALAVPELADNACDVICEAIYLSKLRVSAATLRPILLEHIAALREPLHQCVKSDDIEQVYIFASIFTDLGKSMLEDVVEAPTPEK